MCGLFGFIADENQKIDRHILERMAVNTMKRGPHAWGIAWVNAQGKLRMFKQTGRIVDKLGLLTTLAHDATMLIGHCRYATHGDPSNNLNNHPHPCDGGWIVHNGQIHNHKDIRLGYGLTRHTECDSEVVGLVIEDSDGDILQRTRQALEICRGSSPFAIMGIWRNSLVIAKDNEQPLHIGEANSGYYMSSLAGGLTDDCWNIQRFKDGEAHCFGSTSLTTNNDKELTNEPV